MPVREVHPQDLLQGKEIILRDNIYILEKRRTAFPIRSLITFHQTNKTDTKHQASSVLASQSISECNTVGITARNHSFA